MEWTGIMAYTFDSQPIVGEDPDREGLWICAGFNGHGKSIRLKTNSYLLICTRYGTHIPICRGIGAAPDGKRKGG
jgi:hypothetical protein